MIRPLRALPAALAAALAIGAAEPANAADEVNTSVGLAATGAPLALHGYDPVAYFTVSKPTPGDARFHASHDGATYYFASSGNRDAFVKEPDKFAPAFGGFCAYGVAVGKKFDGSPQFWSVVDGVLYLNLNAEIAATFKKDVAGNIAKAEQQWMSIIHTPASDL